MASAVKWVQEHAKTIVAVVAAVATVLVAHGANSTVLDSIIAVAGALGVYAIPNVKK